MVRSATTLGRNGLQDWLIQRVTAIVLGVYTLFLFTYLIVNAEYHYDSWRALLTSSWMRYASLLALISLIAHAWIGIWTVITDYIKPIYIRLPMQIMLILSLLLYFAWGINILWG